MSTKGDFETASEFAAKLDVVLDAARRHYAANMNFSRSTPGAIADCVNELKVQRQAVLDAHSGVVAELRAADECNQALVQQMSLNTVENLRVERELAAAQAINWTDRKLAEVEAERNAARAEVERLKAAIRDAHHWTAILHEGEVVRYACIFTGNEEDDCTPENCIWLQVKG